MYGVFSCTFRIRLWVFFTQPAGGVVFFKKTKSIAILSTLAIAKSFHAEPSYSWSFNPRLGLCIQFDGRVCHPLSCLSMRCPLAVMR
jgi:hypothetical protein